MKNQSIRTLDTPAQLQSDIKALITIEPRFERVYQQVGLPGLRRNSGGFEQLMRAMVGQELSVAAELISPQAILHAEDEVLREQGLSRQKIRYLRSLVEHDIDFEALQYLSDAEVIKTLTAVTGIGNWTAEMYLLFSLGRADVLAVDDLAIKVGAMALLQLEARPTPKQLKSLTQSWAPYRSAASLLLWSHYGWLKDRDAVPV